MAHHAEWKKVTQRHRQVEKISYRTDVTVLGVTLDIDLSTCKRKRHESVCIDRGCPYGKTDRWVHPLRYVACATSTQVRLINLGRPETVGNFI